jgi:predicted molibdopterin-dependent oxidoreductase YjgC
VSDAFSLSPFFENLGGELATHRDIRFAKTIVLIGGEPEELQPLTGKQIRQAVRNGGAKLIIINSRPIRLREQASSFVHIRPGTKTLLCSRWRIVKTRSRGKQDGYRLQRARGGPQVDPGTPRVI